MLGVSMEHLKREGGGLSWETKLLFHNLRRLLSPQGGDRSEDLNLTREARSDGARGKRQERGHEHIEQHQMQRMNRV